MCLKTESKAVITQGSITVRVENLELKPTDKLSPEVLFEVLAIEVAFFAMDTHEVGIDMKISKSALYYKTGFVYTGAGPNSINEAYLMLYCKILH